MKILRLLVAFCASLPLLPFCSANALAATDIALYYGQHIPLKEFRVFDTIVVEPDHGHDPLVWRAADTELYAYVSVAEVHASRPYYTSIPAHWKLAKNADWNSEVIDQTPPEWPEFFANEVIAPLWNKGYRGFFLDTLDSYRLLPDFNEQAQQQGLIRVIETLHKRFPGIALILNRGFEIVPAVKDKIRMVAAESLFRRWSAGGARYDKVPEADREWLLAQLNTIRQRDGVEILVIDYVPPHERQLARETADKIRALGFTPWVTDAKLESIGVGRIEAVPRRVLIVYDSKESPSLNYSNAHRYLQLPLNHMGYVVDYADVQKPLPDEIFGDRYAGVATWFSGSIAAGRQRPLIQWLGKQIEQRMPLAIIGDPGFQVDRGFAARLGLKTTDAQAKQPLNISQQHAMIGFEAPPMVSRHDAPTLQAAGTPPEQTLLELRDAGGQRYLAGAILPWGGFILDPFALIEVPGSDQARWVIDPFAFLQSALRLPAIPIPDTTTENGRRLFFSHIDGDGFPSRAELPGSPFAAQALLDEILSAYRIPTTVSVVESEVAPHGLYPKLSPQLEDIARRIFRLPHVEIASHTWSHPFVWDTSVTGVTSNKNREEGLYHLDIPGYTFDAVRETVGSAAYIRDRLAPPGKPVKILLWSGDTAPGADTLRLTEQAGLLNMNGGDTSITRANPSLTAVGALGIEKSGLLQVYAPITNENIYTNLWTGPYYGYEKVIESLEMTNAPRRLKPVDIYYHTYSASKRAGLNALHKAFAWTKTQELHPVFASEFIRKVQDFHAIAIARDNGGWRIRGNGQLRTLRWNGGAPRLIDAVSVAGYRDGREGWYIHLGDGAAWFAADEKKSDAAPSRPFLRDANARLSDWQATPTRLAFRLNGHVPIEFSLANLAGCTVRIDGKQAAPGRRKTQDALSVHSFGSPHASARVEVDCAR